MEIPMTEFEVSVLVVLCFMLLVAWCLYDVEKRLKTIQKGLGLSVTTKGLKNSKNIGDTQDKQKETTEKIIGK